MSRWKHQGCPKCGSSDALSSKEGDEWGYCFACGKSSRLDGKKGAKPEENIMVDFKSIQTFETRGHRDRQITKTVMEAFDVKCSYNEQGEIEAYFYPYYAPNAGTVVSYKERQLPKKFLVHGDFSKSVGFFGPPTNGGSNTLIITEGELDALSVAQAQYDKYQKFFPVVSLASASQTKVFINHLDWLKTFKTVILWMDNDEAGKKAESELAKIVGYDRVKVVRHPEKDASDVLVKLGSEAVMRAVWDAQEYSPAGIVRGEAVWSHLVERKNIESVPYPKCLTGINEKTKGMRMGEIVLFTSGTGSGKSTVIKEIVLDVLSKSDDMVGMVSLEESIGDTAEKFVSMALGKNIREEETDEKELRAGFEKVFNSGKLVLLDHQGSVSDESLVSKLDHLALIGCKYIILDHITIAVSEGAQGKTGNEAVDSVMSDLLKIVKKHNIWMGVISHLRKVGQGQKPFEQGTLPSLDDIKGSGSIKQISFDIIGFARNMVAESESERNLIKFRVLKSRFTGQTGDAGTTAYNPLTGRLTYQTLEADFD